MGRINFRSDEKTKPRQNMFYFVLLLLVICVLIIDVCLKAVYYFHYKPQGGVFINNDISGMTNLPKHTAVLHPGLTSLKIAKIDSNSPWLGLGLLIGEAALMCYIFIRILLQKKVIAYSNSSGDKEYIVKLQLGKYPAQQFAYYVLFFCLVVSVIDRSYTKEVGKKHHAYAIIDGIPAKIHQAQIYFNITDVILLSMAIFLIIHTIGMGIEKIIKGYLIKTESAEK